MQKSNQCDVSLKNLLFTVITDMERWVFMRDSWGGMK